MDERNCRTGRTACAVRAVLALLCVCMTVLLVREIRMEKETRKRTGLLLEQASELNETLSGLSAELERVRADIEFTADIEARTEAARDRFFDDAGLLEQMVTEGKTDVRIAYLTFDDGPYELTWDYLEVLSRYEVLATFFQRGRDWDRFGEIYEAVRDGCHTMGNHTYSHKIRNGIYVSADAFMADTLKNRQYLQEKLGVTTRVLRFPGGSSTAGRLKQEIIEGLREEGYAYVDWNNATGDGMYDLSAEAYRDNVLNNTNGIKLMVVLMHDYNRNTLAALPEIIEGLQTQGYVFLPLFYDSMAVNR
jgi:peptidoglycan/xylan/chitin deacetylase (PgdA/CDA1 family)